MIDKKLVQKVNDIRRICASVKMPVSVEKDTTPDGIDGLLILGDIPFVKQGDIFEINFSITLQYSTTKNNWEMFIERLGLISQKLSADERHHITGWTKQDDESKLIYSCDIVLKGRVNADLLV